MNFDRDKKVGDKIEAAVLQMIKVKYPKAYIDNQRGKFSGWDIYVPELKSGVEVKGDYKSKQTGNICIEVEMFEKPSALSITESAWWIIVDGFCFIWVRPIDIYRYIEQKKLMRTRIFGKDDEFEKFVYLINRDAFIDYVQSIHMGRVYEIDEAHTLFYNNFQSNL